ncbi:protein translocase SEC61 complex subunit gamma [Candidatus Micrarchaeota archaeon]|nr:protein translocase SEC61 complex subunit gamma [Candidatus Micrarchaeota archaeon]
MEFKESFIQKSIRVFHVFYKPKYEEFITIAKTTALGMVVIGAIGFVVTLLFRVIG